MGYPSPEFHISRKRASIALPRGADLTEIVISFSDLLSSISFNYHAQYIAQERRNANLIYMRCAREDD